MEVSVLRDSQRNMAHETVHVRSYMRTVGTGQTARRGKRFPLLPAWSEGRVEGNCLTMLCDRIPSAKYGLVTCRIFFSPSQDLMLVNRRFTTMVGFASSKLPGHCVPLQGQESDRYSLSLYCANRTDSTGGLIAVSTHTSGHSVWIWSCQLKLSSRGLLML